MNHDTAIFNFINMDVIDWPENFRLAVISLCTSLFSHIMTSSDVTMSPCYVFLSCSSKTFSWNNFFFGIFLVINKTNHCKKCLIFCFTNFCCYVLVAFFINVFRAYFICKHMFYQKIGCFTFSRISFFYGPCTVHGHLMAKNVFFFTY